MFKIIKRIIIFVLIFGFIGFGFIIYNGYNLYKNALNTINLMEKTAQIQEDNSYAKLDNLPIYYKNAVISVEDHRFYNHGPIDLFAIARATFSNIRYGKFLEGGSTITQQVAKNLYFINTDSNSIYRKIAEIFMAYDLEKNYEKDEVLEFYINTIYFGDGYYGIEEACNGYLNKNAKDMSLYEATMMAGIPNAPSVYAPTVNLDLTLSRQRKVISTMVENEYITQEQANELISMQNQFSI